MFGIVAVYQNTTSQRVLVQRFAKHPIGVPGEICEPAIIDGTELSSRLVIEVLAALNAYGTEAFDATKARTLRGAEYRMFLKEHNRISVTRWEDGSIEVLPSRHVRGGFVGCGEHKKVLRAGEVASCLYCTIMDALRLAD